MRNIFVILIIMASLAITQTKMHVNTKSGTTDFILNDINSITFTSLNSLNIFDDFENGMNTSQWNFSGSQTNIDSSQYHSGNKSLFLRGADFDGGPSIFQAKNPFLISTGTIEFWFKGVELGNGSGGSADDGSFWVIWGDSSYSNQFMIGQQINFGDSLGIRVDIGGTTIHKKCGINLRNLTGWHRMTVLFSSVNSQITVIASIDGVEGVRSTFPFSTRLSGVYLRVGGQYMHTSQAYIDDISILGN